MSHEQGGCQHGDAPARRARMVVGVDLDGIDLDAEVRQCRACGACEVGGAWRAVTGPGSPWPCSQ